MTDENGKCLATIETGSGPLMFWDYDDFVRMILLAREAKHWIDLPNEWMATVYGALLAAAPAYIVTCRVTEASTGKRLVNVSATIVLRPDVVRLVIRVPRRKLCLELKLGQLTELLAVFEANGLQARSALETRTPLLGAT